MTPTSPNLPEPGACEDLTVVAHLVTGGRVFRDAVVKSSETAERDIANRRDGSISTPLVRLSDAQLLAAEVERLRADADHHRQLFNVSKLGHEQAFAQCQRLSALLRRSLSQLGKWQRKYGEHDPAWLPPDGDVRLAEDIDAALDASRLALKEAL